MPLVNFKGSVMLEILAARYLCAQTIITKIVLLPSKVMMDLPLKATREPASTMNE